jgi:hypothetical protein
MVPIIVYGYIYDEGVDITINNNHTSIYIVYSIYILYTIILNTVKY